MTQHSSPHLGGKVAALISSGVCAAEVASADHCIAPACTATMKSTTCGTFLRPLHCVDTLLFPGLRSGCWTTQVGGLGGVCPTAVP